MVRMKYSVIIKPDSEIDLVHRGSSSYQFKIGARYYWSDKMNKWQAYQIDRVLFEIRERARLLEQPVQLVKYIVVEQDGRAVKHGGLELNYTSQAKARTAAVSLRRFFKLLD